VAAARLHDNIRLYSQTVFFAGEHFTVYPSIYLLLIDKGGMKIETLPDMRDPIFKRG
jgi:hypothetical protein